MTAEANDPDFLIPEPSGGWGPPWTQVFELAAQADRKSWALIGGLMVQAHAMAAGINAIRPTDDVDVVADIGTWPDALNDVLTALEALGFVVLPPVGPGPVHRFVRESGGQVDVGVADHGGPKIERLRIVRRTVLKIDGTSQALKRLCVFGFSHEGSVVQVQVPDALGALVLKGAAYLVDSRDRDRHLSDAALLASTILDHRAQISRLAGSDRARLLKVRSALADENHPAWHALASDAVQRAGDTLRLLTANPQSRPKPRVLRVRDPD